MPGIEVGIGCCIVPGIVTGMCMDDDPGVIKLLFGAKLEPTDCGWFACC